MGFPHPEPIIHVLDHPKQLQEIVCTRGHDSAPYDARGHDEELPLPLDREEATEGADPEGHAERDPDDVKMVKLLDDNEDGGSDEDPHLEAGHEEAAESEEHGGQATDDAHTYGDADVSPMERELCSMQTRKMTTEARMKTNQEHDGLEASIACIEERDEN